MLAVIMGAFATHGLKQRLSAEMLGVFNTGAQYHFYHAIGLILVGLVAAHISTPGIKWSGWLMLAGIIFFSGSLYLLAMTGMRWLGMITPLGGVCFIMAWLMLALTVLRN